MDSNGQFVRGSWGMLALQSFAYVTHLTQAFKDATMFFSRADANLASVIPAMDKLDTMLATAVIEKGAGEPDIVLSAPMKAAVLVSKDTLNKYYNLSDESELYRIALSMYLIFLCLYIDRLCSSPSQA